MRRERGKDNETQTHTDRPNTDTNKGKKNQTHVQTQEETDIERLKDFVINRNMDKSHRSTLD